MRRQEEEDIALSALHQKGCHGDTTLRHRLPCGCSRIEDREHRAVQDPLSEKTEQEVKVDKRKKKEVDGRKKDLGS